MHPLLTRQLRKAGIVDASQPPLGPAWVALLERLDHSFTLADQDRYTLERSLAISSREMAELNANVRHAADALAQERDKLHALIVSTADGLCTLDVEGRITRVNPAAEQLLSRSAHELIGRDLLGDVLDRASQPLLSSALGAACAVRCDDGVFQRCGGAAFPVAFALSPIAHAGQRIGSVLVFRDTTEQKRVQLDLEAARAAAEAASRAKSTFLATMSHEIRTPLNGVIGMAELLADTALDGEQGDYVETIHKSGSTLLAIINDILDFSKIEAGMLELEEVDFDLRTAVEDVLEMLADRAHAKDIELVGSIARDVPLAMRGDPWRLRQVLTNLIGNAIKYTPRGEVVLSIACQRHDDSTSTLRVRVRDSGCGVPHPARERLFKPFSQVDSSDARRFGGTGLGLAISRMLVERMGGAIGYEDAPGGGSVFWFEVELRTNPAPQARGEPPAAPEKRRVAIVDAHAVTRAVVGELARDCDCEVHEFASLAAAREARCSVLIVDQQLWARRDVGACDGQAGLIIMGARSRRPIVGAATGDAEAYRPRTFVAKPVRASALEKALVDVFEGQRAERQAPARELAPAPAALPRDNVRRLRILVAEDNVVNQKVIARMLARLGHEFAIVETGALAIEATLNGGFDLVLMDCQMPEVDGFEATKRIQATPPPFRAPPIVALTANAMSGDEQRCREAGMVDYLTKPLRMAELDRVLLGLFPERTTIQRASGSV